MPGGTLLFRGGQLDHDPLGAFLFKEWFQGVQPQVGVDTLIYTLKHHPAKREAVKLFVGTVSPGGDSLLQRLGVDYDVDIATREVTWKAGATHTPGPGSLFLVTYFRRGPRFPNGVGVF